jgi:hypothetical protein
MELVSRVELLASPIELKDAELDAVSAGRDDDLVDVKNNDVNVQAAVLSKGIQVADQRG